MSDLFDELDASMALSTEALSALTEFLAEQKEQDDAFTSMQLAAHQKSYHTSGVNTPRSEYDDDAALPTMKLFQEDWQLSQFWYDDDSAKTMGDELVAQAKGGMIVCVSAPTVFLYLKVVSAHGIIMFLDFSLTAEPGHFQPPRAARNRHAVCSVLRVQDVRLQQPAGRRGSG